ncbi:MULTISPECIES: ester cyclase [unclassified Rhizobacter]|uniref:ester cyclase n=1 Tax=unclassified Rhizobacter TaxID=2640088 RepID=UPI000700EDF4|nr:MULTISPECIES: ester cyclase [unclassified Rhizobacter]KQU81647.1 ester cyclase [Rhizobacter sp. Root29]KQW12024.1 ester cyclase [Rhizobacter sp. Root1238]KRB13396.1 ester cyclase [Rhizobacter sp. Root16D2]
MSPSNLLRPSSSDQARRHAIELLYRAFSDHDPDLLDLAVTADWDDIPLAPGQGPGPDGLKPIIRSVVEALPDVRITIHDVLMGEDRAAVRAEITGTHRGPLFGIAATGRKVSIRIHEFHEFDGERIKRTWHLEDWFGAFLQLGAFPALTHD